MQIAVDETTVCHRYAKEKRARRLQECSERLEQSKSEIRELEVTIENIRNAIAEIDKEINESGASMANLRDNIRARKLIQDVKTTQAEMNRLDMEEAAKARRTFDEKFKDEKQKEVDMQRKVVIF
jgi:DNA repair protein RAD50